MTMVHEPAGLPRFWIVGYDWRTDERLQRLQDEGLVLGSEEQNRFGAAWTALHWARPSEDICPPLVPHDFPAPRLRFPQQDFAPDYMYLGPITLVSRRLRETLALAEAGVQYLPIEISSSSPAARAQDYRWINIRACYPALDMAQSSYDTYEFTHPITGEQHQMHWLFDRIALRDEIDPAAQLFRAAEHTTFVLAADLLAERVMRAGCTGIVFEDPDTVPGFGRPIHRYRTATGVMEEDMNQVYPPAP